MVLAVLLLSPVIIFTVATLFGFMLAEAEGWSPINGFHYSITLVMGLPGCLTDRTTVSKAGNVFDIAISLLAMILTSILLGVTAILHFVNRATRCMPRNAFGGISLLLCILPILMLLAVAFGFLIARAEGWAFMDGARYMVGTLCGLGNPLTDLSVSTPMGSFLEMFCSVLNLSFSGCIVGIVTVHPSFRRFVVLLEGTFDEEDCGSDVAKICPTDVATESGEERSWDELLSENAYLKDQIQRLQDNNWRLQHGDEPDLDALSDCDADLPPPLAPPSMPPPRQY